MLLLAMAAQRSGPLSSHGEPWQPEGAGRVARLWLEGTPCGSLPLRGWPSPQRHWAALRPWLLTVDTGVRHRP